MSLTEYQKKRDFKRTKEPAAKRASKTARTRQKVGDSFVIQKHDATRLHYDLRLEIEGVLKSWAVPKGIPLEEGDKRLAVEVEDHPLEYASFEGIIPEGSYGGGTVIIWDKGRMAIHGDAMAAWKKGHVHFILDGHKLHGEWILIRTGREENHWLLMKTGGNHPRLTKKQDEISAVSGRTIKQISVAPEKKVWQSDKTKTEALRFIEPMLAKPVKDAPQGNDWAYEIKFDGYRILGVKSRGVVTLFSRNQKDLSKRFAEIHDALAALKDEEFIIDSEVVALNEDGLPSFQLLQNSEENDAPLACYVFDLLHLNGEDFVDEPLEKRRVRLGKWMKKATSPLLFSADLEGKVEDIMANMEKLGMEGIIAKRRDATYEAGRRSGAWVKVKCEESQEFVIGGYTLPKGSRQHLGALLVGYYDDGKLRYAGRVGTGMDTKTCKELQAMLDKLKVPEPAFEHVPQTPGMRQWIWTKPRVVCQVKFTAWTGDGHLRHPAYLGLREDKKPADVKRESI